MTLQSSGAISLNQINIEAHGSQVSGTEININDVDIRELLFPTVASQAASSFSDFYGAEEYNTAYNYAGGSLASGTGTLHYTMGAGSTYTTGSRTIWVGFVSSTDSENIDMIISASSANLRCKVDLIRPHSNFDFVKSGSNGTAGRMFKDTSVSTSGEICFEGSIGSSGYAWGSTLTRWPIRIMADAGITFTSNASTRNWNFYNTARYTSVSATHFNIAFAQGVQG
jgi:hypothetical protein